MAANALLCQGLLTIWLAVMKLKVIILYYTLVLFVQQEYL